MTEVDKSERKKAYCRQYYEIHKEEYRERYLKNRDRILERNKANKDKKAEYDHKRNIEKFEELSDYKKTYYINHKEYFYEKNKEYRRKKKCV